MAPEKILPGKDRGEHGQTIILVAVCIVSLLAMAALAVDVVTLYVAKGQIQHAADAAALAGAQAMAASGVTSISSTDPNCASAEALAVNMASAAIAALLPWNLVAGGVPTQTGGSPIFSPSNLGGNCPVNNPQVTVTLQQNGIPTPFARIWGHGTTAVKASATAEAYNPANIVPSVQFTPIALTSVKPWLVANADPLNGSAKFVSTTNWTVESGVIGEQFDLTADCQPPPASACDSPSLPDTPPRAHVGVKKRVDYVPARVIPNPSNVCPSSCLGATAYEQSIECADATTYAYLNCGGGTSKMTWDNSWVPGGAAGLSATGSECLIHATGGAGSGQGQDTLTNPAPWPSGPMQITAQSGPLSGNIVSTSNSIVTIPLVDQTTVSSPPAPVTIVGYLQAFINCVEDGTKKDCDQGGTSTAGDINITVLNVVGCGSPNANPAVVGGIGASTIPVRLILP